MSDLVYRRPMRGLTRTYHEYRYFGAAVFDPHRKAGHVMTDRMGLVVINILSVSNAVMQRLDMRIIHRLLGTVLVD